MKRRALQKVCTLKKNTQHRPTYIGGGYAGECTMKPYIIEGCPARYYIGGVVRRQSEALHR